MPVHKTERKEITAHLQALGLRQGMKVVVHSSMMSFGDVEGRTGTFIEELRRVVGEAGTIAMPTFTLRMKSEDVFDPGTTPCMTGALPEAFRRLPGAVRSFCPMHSYAAIGRRAETVSRAAWDYSFGSGSCFEMFLEEGFHWLLLGCGARGEACTLLHHTEAVFGVPYREWIELPRRMRLPDGHVHEVTLNYYARKNDLSLKLPFRPVRDRLIAEGRMTQAQAPLGVSYFANTEAIHTTGLEILGQDPWGLVRSPEPEVASPTR